MSMQMQVTGFIVIAVEKGLSMKHNLLIASMLVLNLMATVSSAETVYQWTDRQGQIHYGDVPPASVNSRPIVLQQGSERVENQTGLRPSERERIVLMEQRQRQQHRRAQKARTRTDKQRTARRTGCADNREMLNISRGRDTFKQYARFLRNNCW